MIKLPELELVNIIKRSLDALKTDYEQQTNKDASVLSLLYKESKYDNYNLFQAAIALFVNNRSYTNESSNRKISIHSYYNRKIIGTPAIHVAAPSESEANMSIGGGYGEGAGFDLGDDRVRESYCKSYLSTHSIIFTSDNHTEVQLMYFTVKYILTSAFDELILESFQNPKISGTALRMESDKAPEHFFSRALTIESFADVEVPSLLTSLVIKAISIPRTNSITSGAIKDSNLTIIVPKEMAGSKI